MILGFDIDGVVATENYVKPYGKPQETWNQYYFRADKIQGAELLNQLYPRHRVVLITGRVEGAREVTVTWLRKNNVPYHRLCLRKNRRKSIREHKIEAVAKEECDHFFDNKKSLIKEMKVRLTTPSIHHFKSWNKVQRILDDAL